jgi:phosphohistidine phosphatase SixA
VGRSRMRHDTRTPEEVIRPLRQLELRRHARRDLEADRLSASGRAQAEDVGRAVSTDYDIVFVSPSQRAAETAAWFLRGAGLQLPEHEIVPGLGGGDASGGSPTGMAAGVRALLDRVPDGGRGLAISHTPLVEHAALGLTGNETELFGECEGILVTLQDDGSIDVVELRLDEGSQAG